MEGDPVHHISLPKTFIYEQGLKFSLGLPLPVGQVVSNCYSPLIKLYSFLHLVLKCSKRQKKINCVTVVIYNAFYYMTVTD